MNKWLDFVIKHPKFIITVIIVIALICLSILPKVPIDSTVDALYLKEGLNYKFFQIWKRQFGTDDFIIIAIKSPQIFTKRGLEFIKDISDKIDNFEYVRRVISLTNVNDIMGKARYFIVDKFLKLIPRSKDELNNLKKRALNNPLYVKRLISKDGTTIAVLVELKSIEGNKYYKKETIEKIKRLLNKVSFKDLEFYLSGPVVRDYYFAYYMQKDLRTFLPLVLLLMTVILVFVFRNFIGVVLPLITVLLSLLGTMVALYLYGSSINNVTTILPPLIIALAVADSIHILTEYFQKNNKNNNTQKQIVKKTFLELAKPCFLTSFTTAVGFSSLAVSHIPAVRDFGIVAGIGIIIAFILSFSFLPAILVIFPPGKKRGKEYSIITEQLLEKISGSYVKYSNGILIFTAISIFVSIWGITRLKIGTNLLEYFKKKSYIYRATTFIEDNLSGIHFLNISIKGNRKDIFKEPKVLKEIEKLHSFLTQIKGVDKVISLIDYIKKMNQAFHNNNQSYYSIPETKEAVAQFLLLYDADDIADYIDFSYRWATIRVRITEHDSTQLARILKTIDNYLKEHFEPDFEVKLTGHTVLETEINESLLKDQINSLLLAMIIIFGTLFFIFRSLKIGLISLVANCLPIILNFGIMGLFGIRLNTATAMIAAVAIGIIVDDTIHYLCAYSDYYRNIPNKEKALQTATILKGRAIITTSLILALSFGILAFSGFVPTINFGILSAIIMITALLADLFLLPSLLLKFNR